jgi:hypothetical protein
LLGQETSIPNLTVGTDIPNFWSVGGFSFELKNSANISTTESFLNITGDGIISGPAGFDATPGTFSLTATRTGDNIITFGFLADTTAVPDGGATAMLIGAGLLGLGALRRKVS